MGQDVGKRGKEEIFTVLGEKKHLGKGGGAKISMIKIIYTPAMSLGREDLFIDKWPD